MTYEQSLDQTSDYANRHVLGRHHSARGDVRRRHRSTTPEDRSLVSRADYSLLDAVTSLPRPTHIEYGRPALARGVRQLRLPARSAFGRVIHKETKSYAHIRN